MNKNWHQKHRDESSVGKLFSDKVTSLVGSWLFIIIHVFWFSAWVMIPIEPFPYGFLTMIVSLEAILLTTLVMMSENRQSERDRVQAEADYDTNISAKKEIEEIRKHLTHIEDEKLDKIIRLLEERQ